MALAEKTPLLGTNPNLGVIPMSSLGYERQPHPAEFFLSAFCTQVFHVSSPRNPVSFFRYCANTVFDAVSFSMQQITYTESNMSFHGGR
jgi:hypothetical protein